MKRPTDLTLTVTVALLFVAGWLGTAAAMRLLGVS